ncbi:Gag [Moniliophthora roreri MCA 2997]|uniref:Gag n=1 Tax=Moniliophthora roreri (strain MCA 2997) TaxID=1381753 RepID=V2W237_MONRO|nr:Gag [Moniliophthora roreri MCA 2997]
MDAGDRLSQIEAELELSAERHTATQSALEALLSAMEQLKSSSQQPPPLPTAPPPPVPPLGPTTTATSDPTARKPPKLAPPPEFDGDHTKGRAFITACQLYIQAHGGFQSDTQKIMWVFSYMTKGDAAAWATMCTEQIIGANSDWGTWDGFLTEFRMCFTVLDAPALAQSHLKTDAYFMKNHALDEYTDKFMCLIYELGYTDDLVKVEQFCVGLKPSIATCIGTSHPCPAADDFNGWVEHACILYKNNVETAAFHSQIAVLKSTIPPRSTTLPHTSSSFSSNI